MNAERVMALICANYPVNTPSSLLSWDSTGTSQHHTLPKGLSTLKCLYIFKKTKKLETAEIEIKGGRRKKLKIASNNFSLNKYACFKIHLRVSDKEMRIPTSSST